MSCDAHRASGLTSHEKVRSTSEIAVKQKLPKLRGDDLVWPGSVPPNAPQACNMQHQPRYIEMRRISDRPSEPNPKVKLQIRQRSEQQQSSPPSYRCYCRKHAGMHVDPALCGASIHRARHCWVDGLENASGQSRGALRRC